MTGKIFINYRRGDDPGFTGRLFDQLEQAFSPDQLFIDVDNIEPGLDFVSVIDSQIEASDVVLAVIGQGWLQATDDSGNRRLDNPNDFVRLEISSAIQQNKHLIPVLVNNAQMPDSEDLPEPLKPLARRNAVRLTHERFRTDCGGLIEALKRRLTVSDDTVAEAKRPVASCAEKLVPVAQSESSSGSEKKPLGVEVSWLHLFLVAFVFFVGVFIVSGAVDAVFSFCATVLCGWSGSEVAQRAANNKLLLSTASSIGMAACMIVAVYFLYISALGFNPNDLSVRDAVLATTLSGVVGVIFAALRSQRISR